MENHKTTVPLFITILAVFLSTLSFVSAAEAEFNVVPGMTSDFTPVPFVSNASSFLNAGSAPWHAFADSTGDIESWLTASGQAFPSFIWINLSNSTNVITTYGVKASKNAVPNRAPEDFCLYGTNTLATFVELDCQTGQTSWGQNEERNFTFPFDVGFDIYFLNITDNNGDGSFTELNELLLYANESAPADASPTVALVSPNDGDRNNTEPTIFFQADDTDSPLVNCTLNVNSTGVMTVNTTSNGVTTGVESSVGFTNLGLNEVTEDFQYFVSCNDEGARAGNSANRTIQLDTIIPFLDSFTPTSQTFDVTTQNITIIGTISDVGTLFNFSAILSNTTEPDLATFFNDTLSLTSLSMTGFIDLTNFAAGNYTMSVHASDPSNSATELNTFDQNFTYTLVFSPTITLISPNDNHRNNTEPTIFYQVDDPDSATNTCTLNVNSSGVMSINTTAVGVVTGSQANISFTDLGTTSVTEDFLYFVSCTDGSLAANSENRTIEIDTIVPVIISFTPGTGSFDPLTENITINGTATDAGTLFNFSAILSNTTEPDLSTFFNDTVGLNSKSLAGFIDLSLLAGGTYTMTVRASDPSNSATELNFVEQNFTYTLTVPDVIPQVTLISPSDGDRNNTEPLIFFQLDDLDSPLANCTLNVNSTGVMSVNTTKNDIVEGVEENISFTNLGLNEVLEDFQYFVSCTDESLNAGNSENRTIQIDTILPLLTSFTPGTDTFDPETENVTINGVITDPGTLFNFSAVLSNSSEPALSVFFNDTSSLTSLALTGDIDLTLLAEGVYTMTVRASDPSTSQNIKPFTIDKNVQASQLTYDDEVLISLKSSSVPLDEFSTTKFPDRYRWNYDFSQSNGKSQAVRNYIFNIDSVNDIHYVEDHPTKLALFVIPDSNKWVSFDFDGAVRDDFNIVKIKDNKYDIHIRTKETDLNFNSVGELNIFEQNFTYTVEIPVISPITGRTVLPLETGANIVAMILLFLLILGFYKGILGGKK